MSKKPDVTVTLATACFPDVIKCRECGKPAEVFSVYGECEDVRCASCYVRQTLPKMTIKAGDRADFDSAWVGTSYFIDSFEFPE